MYNTSATPVDLFFIANTFHSFVVQKQDQRTGKLTDGVVMRILTNSRNHPRGIKVMLEGGIVGRVQQIIEIDAER